MNKNIIQFQHWYKLRSSKQRIYILIATIFIVYFLWSLFFTRSVKAQQDALVAQIQSTQAQIALLKQQNIVIFNAVSQPRFRQELAQDRKLSIESTQITHRLETIDKVVTSAESIPKVMSDILLVQEGVTLLNLKKLPIKPLASPTDTSIDLPAAIKNVYQYPLEMELQGSYFNILAYLQKIEKIPWHIYWDSFDYKVTTYPLATVTVRLHILTYQKSAL